MLGFCAGCNIGHFQQGTDVGCAGCHRGRARSSQGKKLAAAGGHDLRSHHCRPPPQAVDKRSEEHTSELQSLMRLSYAVFCLKKNKLEHAILSHTYHLKYHITHFLILNKDKTTNTILQIYTTIPPTTTSTT